MVSEQKERNWRGKEEEKMTALGFDGLVLSRARERGVELQLRNCRTISGGGRGGGVAQLPFIGLE